MFNNINTSNFSLVHYLINLLWINHFFNKMSLQVKKKSILRTSDLHAKKKIANRIDDFQYSLQDERVKNAVDFYLDSLPLILPNWRQFCTNHTRPCGFGEELYHEQERVGSEDTTKKAMEKWCSIKSEKIFLRVSSSGSTTPLSTTLHSCFPTCKPNKLTCFPCSSLAGLNFVCNWEFMRKG